MRGAALAEVLGNAMIEKAAAHAEEGRAKARSEATRIASSLTRRAL